MSDNKSKGNLLEDVVVLLHQEPGVRVDTRVKLDCINGGHREIDVLLTSSIAGYPVRIVIECKNEKGRVGITKIGAFIGKLQDVGVPPAHGIYVSSVGYTSGALKRAKAAGMRALVLEGSTADRLGTAIFEARQSIIYVLARWRRMSHFPWVPGIASSCCGKIIRI